MSNPQNLISLAEQLANAGRELQELGGKFLTIASTLEQEAANIAEERAKAARLAARAHADVDVNVHVGVRTGGIRTRHPCCGACISEGKEGPGNTTVVVNKAGSAVGSKVGSAVGSKWGAPGGGN